MGLGKDFYFLFVTRFLRLFAFGFLTVALTLYLTKPGISAPTVGFLFSLALLGDIGISLGITTSADRLGRRRMLIVSALLILSAGVVLAGTSNIFWIGLAAPFLLAGSLKIIYDLLLYRSFRALKPPEER